MCFSSAFFKPSRKVKFLVLVGFCVMILTWIATFGNVTNTVRDRLQLVELMRSQKVVTEGLRNAEESKWGNRHPSPAPVATLQPCPALSPHLLIFLTLRLRYKGYFGGVTAMTREQFSKVNGFSNTYWGWGGEDDDLRIRVELQRMKIVRPSPEVARYTMIFHTRDNGNEVNKDRMRLLSRTSRVWKTDGLNSCTYKELSLERVPLYINVTVDIGKPPGHP
ncbi:UNVERIFIED_CONTAM: hypothetical protein FKN15_076559 [Acipenser sinensis]